MKEKFKGYKFEELFSPHEVFHAFALSSFTYLQTSKLCLPGTLAVPCHNTLDVSVVCLQHLAGREALMGQVF